MSFLWDTFVKVNRGSPLCTELTSQYLRQVLSYTCRDAQQKGLEGQGSSQGEALVQAYSMDCIDGPVGPVVFGKRYWPEAEEGTDWDIEADRTKRWLWTGGVWFLL